MSRSDVVVVGGAISTGLRAQAEGGLVRPDPSGVESSPARSGDDLDLRSEKASARSDE